VEKNKFVVGRLCSSVSQIFISDTSVQILVNSDIKNLMSLGCVCVGVCVCVCVCVRACTCENEINRLGGTKGHGKSRGLIFFLLKRK
jgi:hypothetical protein